jgi:ubiquinone/menaquinone biosynthesis C-methylase UbiE
MWGAAGTGRFVTTKLTTSCGIDPTQSDCSAEDLQTRYYTTTARQYDRMHAAHLSDEHFFALELVNGLSRAYGLNSFLDVGAGTGRATKALLKRGHPVRGIEPVPALIELAEASGVPKGLIVQGSGSDLPFEDNAFDAVIECGVLHHVKDPSAIVREMMRVATKAIFLSDANRFGQGPMPARILKLLLYKCHLWNLARFVQTKGKIYTFSEGDGIAYSYSVFDSYRELYDWADQLFVIPTAPGPTPSPCMPSSISAPHALLCAFKGVRA